MNLVLGILWLAGAIALFAYGAATGESPLRIRMLNNVSGAWVLLLLAAWNFVRWYSSRMGRKAQQELLIEHEARLRKVRLRDRPAVPDPTFDFSDRPAAASQQQPPDQQPPSPN
jgi:hypothetical protein